MLFNSQQFLLFFPLVTLLYFLIPHRFRWIHLLVASCVFYMAFIPVYIFILFFTIIIDYVTGIMIENSNEQKKKKKFLILSIAANLGVLFFFKYFNFFTTIINDTLNLFHIHAHPIPFFNIILPLGLSFHTFQALSYTIEVYRGKQKAERHLGIYALYVMFYPQLVAGPIERPQNLLLQLKEEHKFNPQFLLDGLRLMLWGFFKKLVIADRLSMYVDSVFNFPEQYHYLNLIIATFFFSIQIYCDFSGYSDIAIGAAKTMGFDLMQNFDRPYFSKNIAEFWRRWHISLSTWFKDYVYIPLGGNKKRVFFNLAVVFILSGLWHGANWTFLVWGLLHAVYVLAYKLVEDKFVSLPKFISIVLTFSLVSLAWIFFRANSVSDAFLIVKNIFCLDSSHPFQSVVITNDELGRFGGFSIIIGMFFVALLGLVEKSLARLQNLNPYPVKDILFSVYILVLLIFFGIFNNSSFIYFQF